MFSSHKGVNNQYFLIIILAQAVTYLSLWLWDEYVATYITLIFPAMILVILILAGIADLIEPSRISGSYYKLMIISILIPIIIGVVFYYINDGHIAWMTE